MVSNASSRVSWAVLLLLASAVSGCMALPVSMTPSRSHSSRSLPPAESYLKQGDRHFKAGRYQEAKTAYYAAAMYEDAAVDGYFGLARVQEMLGDWGMAKYHYTRVLELKPSCAAALNNRGMIHRRQGDYDDALVDLNEAVRLAPDELQYRRSRSTAYRYAGRYREALDDYDAVLAKDPDDTDIRIERGRALMMLRRNAEALVELQRLLTAEPSNRAAREYLAYLFLSEGKLDRAAREAMAVLEQGGCRDEHGLRCAIIAMNALPETRRQEVSDLVVLEGNPSAWPYPIVRYFRSEIDASGLLKTTSNPAQRTEAKTWIGYSLVQAGKHRESYPYLTWAKSEGDRLAYERILAWVWLEQVPKSIRDELKSSGGRPTIRSLRAEPSRIRQGEKVTWIVEYTAGMKPLQWEQAWVLMKDGRGLFAERKRSFTVRSDATIQKVEYDFPTGVPGGTYTIRVRFRAATGDPWITKTARFQVTD